MVDDSLLEDFINNFYGYGSYQGKYWFIGMEEGGGNSIEEINRRLACWDQRGRVELEDVAEYHFAIGIPEHFKDPVNLQTTWNKLIRILLSAEGETVTLDKVRDYQKNFLGRINGNSCLLELLPLPSPSTGKWIYALHSRLPFLESRELYSSTCSSFRSLHIKNRIAEHKPKAVIFYSFSYKSYWEDISEINFLQGNGGDYYASQNNNSLFIITKHPAAKGVTNKYFENIGKIIRNS